MKQRKQWLDIAKGITIILMVIGHSSIPDYLSNFIFAFHMPLFFISSGLVTNWGKYNIKHFVVHKLHTLIFPFVIYSSIVLVLLKISGGVDVSQILYKGWEGYALWFIPVLFLSLTINKIIKLINHKYLRITLVVCIFITGAILSYFNIYLPWSLSTVPYATFLIFLGSVLKCSCDRIEVIECKGVKICALAIVTMVISHFGRLDMAWNHITPIVPLTIGAVTGTFMLFFISVFIYRYSFVLSKILQAVGQETYIIVAFSQIIIMLLNKFLTLTVIPKYLTLIVLLILIKYIKDYICKLAIKIENTKV